VLQKHGHETGGMTRDNNYFCSTKEIHFHQVASYGQRESGLTMMDISLEAKGNKQETSCKYKSCLSKNHPRNPAKMYTLLQNIHSPVSPASSQPSKTTGVLIHRPQIVCFSGPSRYTHSVFRGPPDHERAGYRYFDWTLSTSTVWKEVVVIVSSRTADAR
jgi:hypothetical protein